MTDQMDYLNDLIGIPFKENGRDRDGLDCYGLVLLIAKELFHTSPPDWVCDFTAADIVSKIEQEMTDQLEADDAVELDGPEDWSVVTVARVKRPYHMGICIAGGVIHCGRQIGVVFQPRGAFISHFPSAALRYWKWGYIGG